MAPNGRKKSLLRECNRLFFFFYSIYFVSLIIDVHERNSFSLLDKENEAKESH